MSEENRFDLIVVGSGPGGYVAAIRAAQLGFNTAIVEKDPHLGGTCLNVGCIPSKALLHSTEMYHFTAHRAAAHGIGMEGLSMDLDQLMAKKDRTVDQLRQGIQQLLKARKITVFKGLGSLAGQETVHVAGEKETHELRAPHIILATGSSPVELPFLPFDGEKIVNSDHAIAFDKVPEKLAVVGGGAIGLELGSVWARLGSAVEVIEFLPNIAPTFDKDVSKMAEKLFKRQGMTFHLKTKVTGFDEEHGKLLLDAEKQGENVRFEADKILVCVGRKPHTTGLGLESAGVGTDDKGRIPVDSKFRTNVTGVYAIGDVIPGPMLAHKAEEDGVACVECIAGQAGHVDYNLVPNVIYTEPEIAGVGLSEADAKEQGFACKSGKFNFMGNGRGIATDATDGFVKVTACKQTDRLLGIQIIAKSASELVASAAAHMTYGGSAEDLARTVHAHPTLSEAIKEAALAVDNNAIHST